MTKKTESTLRLVSDNIVRMSLTIIVILVGGEEGEMEGEWDEFTEEGGGDVEWGDEGGWGGGKVETWTITADSSRLHREAEDEREPSEVSGEVGEEPVQEKRRQSGGTALKLGRKQTGKEEKREKGEGSSGSKVTLSEADRLRLEEQAAWSTEPDFFADMAPSVAKKTGVSASLGGVESPTLTTKQSSSLHYQPAEEEVRVGLCNMYGGEENAHQSFLHKCFVFFYSANFCGQVFFTMDKATYIQFSLSSVLLLFW